VTLLKIHAAGTDQVAEEHYRTLTDDLAPLPVQITRTNRGRVLLEVPDEPAVIAEVGRVLESHDLSYEPVEEFADRSPLEGILEDLRKKTER
jgi:hypothetical protein